LHEINFYFTAFEAESGTVDVKKIFLSLSLEVFIDTFVVVVRVDGKHTFSVDIPHGLCNNFFLPL
jgi:hypothetical protein